MRYTLGNYDLQLISKAPVVIITGSDETAMFCKTVADGIRQCNKAAGELWVCDSLAEFEQRARTPAFFGRWWYSGSADRLSAEDKKALDRIIKKPLDYGTAVLVGVDFMKYRNTTKMTKKSPSVHEISASFPNNKYLIRYVQREIQKRDSKISYGASEALVWRLGEFYSKYEYYLDLIISELPEGASEVTKEHILKTLKGVQGASFDNFIHYLIRPLTSGELKRTNKMFKSYQCVVEDGAVRTLRRVHRKSMQYLEIRRLINEGYIPVGVSFPVDSFKKLLKLPEDDDDVKQPEMKKQAGVVFSYKDILKWSDLKFKREVETAAATTLADWYTIAILSSQTCYKEIEAERVLFDIMTRSRRTDPLKEVR